MLPDALALQRTLPDDALPTPVAAGRTVNCIKRPSQDTTARVLLDDWKAGDAGMTGLAEVIASAFASAFASGLSWGGKLGGRAVLYPPPGLGGHAIMTAFERFIANAPDIVSSRSSS